VNVTFKETRSRPTCHKGQGPNQGHQGRYGETPSHIHVTQEGLFSTIQEASRAAHEKGIIIGLHAVLPALEETVELLNEAATLHVPSETK
jgi:hypothetical protein